MSYPFLKNGEMKRKSDLSFFEGGKYLFPAASPVTNPLPYKPLFPRSTIADFLGETRSLESVLNYFLCMYFFKEKYIERYPHHPLKAPYSSASSSI